MDWLRVSLEVVHGLAGAVWLGAMVYSYAVVHPKSREFFKDEAERERFLTTMGAGARWKVVAAFGIVLVSGVAMLPLTGEKMAMAWWQGLMGAKMLLWVAALGAFWCVSWVMWPRRVFAMEDEVAMWQRRFRSIARVMMALVGAAFVLGVVARG